MYSYKARHTLYLFFVHSLIMYGFSTTTMRLQQITHFTIIFITMFTIVNVNYFIELIHCLILNICICMQHDYLSATV